MGRLTLPVASTALGNNPATTVRPAGRMVFDADAKKLRLHDGETPGGVPIGEFDAEGIPTPFSLAADGGGDGTSASYAAAQKFLENGADGLPVNTVVGAPTNAGDRYFRSAGTPFKVKRQLAFENGPGTVFQNLGTGSGAHAVEINITFALDNVGAGSGGADLPPNTIGEVRGFFWRGGRALAYGGGYGMIVGNEVGGHKPMILGVIENVMMAGATGGFRIEGQSGKDVHWITIRACSIDNGAFDLAQDGIQFWSCNMTGTNPGLTLNKPFGTFNSGLYCGTTANRKGGADIINAVMWRLWNVQFEHGVGQGANNQTYGATVVVRGANYAASWGIISLCNFGGGDDVTTSIAIVNAHGTVIEDCLFNITEDVNKKDILLDNSGAAGSRPSGTVIGKRLQFRGSATARAIRGFGNITDHKRLARIVPSAAPFAELIYGAWLPAFALLEGKTANLIDNNFEVFLSEDGLVSFNKGVKLSTGSFGSALDMFKLPAWLMPIGQIRVPVCSLTEVKPVIVTPSTRFLTTTGAFTGDTLDFSGTTWRACYQAGQFVDSDTAAGAVEGA